MTVNLPRGEMANPSCGACNAETRWHVLGWQCEDCGLKFVGDDLEASYLDDDAKQCAEPFGNWWHGDGKIGVGWRFECHPCQLPAGHASVMHYHGCERIRA